mgnify:CR=1 FL=1
MDLTVRKLVVGLAALGVLIGVYIGYVHFDDASSGVLTVSPAAPVPLVEPNLAEPQQEAPVGSIAGVGVGRVRQTRLVHRNESNEVDRIFGFVELLHQQGDQWAISRPYMELFFPEFHCKVTADQGTVQVETAFGTPVANDAQFSGNVVIHITPTTPDDPLECFIHLDDVEFQAEESLFTTSGTVRFLSRVAQLTGSGMELVYDASRARLELFQIFDLESLRLRSSEFGDFGGLNPAQPAPSSPPQAASSQPAPKPAAPRPVEPPAPETPLSELYQCVARGNVTIEMPDRVTVARDTLRITHIPRGQAEEEQETQEPAPQAATAGMQAAAEPNGAERLPVPGPDALDTSPSAHPEIAAIPEEAFDVVVTCEGGFAITPMGESIGARLAARDAPEKSSRSGGSAPPADRQYVTARRIDVNATTKGAVLDGLVEMRFHVDPNGLIGDRRGGDPVPVTVTAQDSVRYVPTGSRILLEGGCTVDAMQQVQRRLRHEYHLAAPRLALDLAPDPNAGDELALDLDAFAADGGPVALRIMRRGPDGLLGWTRVEAWQLQYHRSPEQFEIVGPGHVWLHNAEMDPNADPNGFSLRRPCYARLSNFDTLTYSATDNRIVAEDEDRQLLLDYFPLVEGEYDRHIVTVAGHVESRLRRLADGQTELASLVASEGIEYEDDENYFVGSRLNYEHEDGTVTVHGDDVLPCMLNGVLVDQIEMNLKTGRLKTDVPGPSILQVRR